jgi:hypothetical protein
MILMMITGFIVCWYIGKQVVHDDNNHIFPVMCGLVGLIAALMIEIILFIIRDERQEQFKEKKLKRQYQQQQQQQQKRAIQVNVKPTSTPHNTMNDVKADISIESTAADGREEEILKQRFDMLMKHKERYTNSMTGCDDDADNDESVGFLNEERKHNADDVKE